MSRFVALLRAINTPPRHVKMDRLAVIGRDVYWSHVGLRRDSEHSEARVPGHSACRRRNGRQQPFVVSQTASSADVRRPVEDR
jgi:hypothetical protein